VVWAAAFDQDLVEVLAGELTFGSGSAMRRAVVNDPEDATGVVIRRSCHHLLDAPVKGMPFLVSQ
jgi:hypothetical protein